MSDCKCCDRCGKIYSRSEMINSFNLNDVRWRYSLHYDAHPYDEYEKDLCATCLNSLYLWFTKYHRGNENG